MCSSGLLDGRQEEPQKHGSGCLRLFSRGVSHICEPTRSLRPHLCALLTAAWWSFIYLRRGHGGMGPTGFWTCASKVERVQDCRSVH